MQIASWNVNSVRARLENIITWIQSAQPDILCFQEIKCETEKFPKEVFEDLGYNLAILGQKSYNGVAILSKYPMSDIIYGLPTFKNDVQARYIEAYIEAGDYGFRIASVYLPNGNPAPSEKFDYKLQWIEHLYQHTKNLLLEEIPFILGGDYNVIPCEDDVYDAKAWEKDALFLPQTKQAWQKILNLGVTETFRACTSEAHHYSFWDYQGGAWQKNKGIRIDHMLLSPMMADRAISSFYDKNTRGVEKASDHVPIIITIN
jgi:exodeoxyribonuclease-3